MSVEMVVFLSAGRMVTSRQWQEAVRQNGFDLEFDADFDPDNLDGFLPCRYKGEECGFEYVRRPVAEAKPPADIQLQIGPRDLAISFITHSDFRDLMASVIAAGILCAQTEGMLYDTEAGAFTAWPEAVEWSRSGEAEIANEL